MTFDEYVSLVKNTAAEQGYDHYFPSACRPGEEIHLDALQCDLTPDGEEAQAKEWAAQILFGDATMYLAYRVGNRKIHVCRIEKRDVVEKVTIEIRPYEGG